MPTSCGSPAYDQDPSSTGRYKALSDVELATVAWIDRWNHRRLHSSIGNGPPAQYEAEPRYGQTSATAPAVLSI